MWFRPILAGALLPGRLLAGIGAVVGIAFAGLAAAWLVGSTTALLIVAPIGASAVLVFAVPASPLAQPWPVVGGNAVSALIALVVVHFVPLSVVAIPVAVGAAIVAMSLARCLHPPGGAVALTVGLLANGTAPAGWLFPFAPVALDSALLVAAGVAFHRLSGHAYPHRPAATPPSAFAPADIDAALADMHETFDIAREDLDALLARAAHHAQVRQAPVRRARSARSSPRR